MWHSQSHTQLRVTTKYSLLCPGTALCYCVISQISFTGSMIFILSNKSSVCDWDVIIKKPPVCPIQHQWLEKVKQQTGGLGGGQLGTRRGAAKRFFTPFNGHFSRELSLQRGFDEHFVTSIYSATAILREYSVNNTKYHHRVQLSLSHTFWAFPTQRRYFVGFYIWN